MSLRTLLAIVAVVYSVSAQASEWNCNDAAAAKEMQINVDADGNVVDVTLADGSKITLPVGTPEQRVALLKKMLQSSSGDSNAFLHWELARQQQMLNQLADAESTLREIFDTNAINTAQRGEARDQIAELLIQQSKPRDVIALYERVDRPVCGELSADAAYVLSQAYLAVGNDAKAQQVFDKIPVNELASGENDLALQKWKLLGLRLDCAQQRWDQCAGTFDALVRMSDRDDSITRQLNTFTARFRKMPQMSNVIERLQREGLITEKGIPTAESGLAQQTDTAADISCPDPVYPAEAKRPGVTVKVTLLLTFDEHGKVSDTKILEAQTDKRYIDGVLAAARLCTVVPPVVLGMPATSSRIRKWNFSVAGSTEAK